MLANTGSISFWLGTLLIIVSFIGIIFIFLSAKYKWVENDVLDRVVNLGKWFIASVAISLFASIINDGFKERDQDLKELAAFEKHLSIIMAADSNVAKRKLLAEYFSAVAPPGPIRDGWEAYDRKINQQMKNNPEK